MHFPREQDGLVHSEPHHRPAGNEDYNVLRLPGKSPLRSIELSRLTIYTIKAAAAARACWRWGRNLKWGRRNWKQRHEQTCSHLHLLLSTTAGEHVMEQESGERAQLPGSSLPCSHQFLQSPKAPIGLQPWEPHQRSLAANQTHTPPTHPSSPPSPGLCQGVQACSEQDASIFCQASVPSTTSTTFFFACRFQAFPALRRPGRKRQSLWHSSPSRQPGTTPCFHSQSSTQLCPLLWEQHPPASWEKKNRAEKGITAESSSANTAHCCSSGRHWLTSFPFQLPNLFL